MLSLNKTKRLREAHVLSLLFVIAMIWMSYYGMSFRGYWTEKIIWWIFYFSGVSVFTSGNPESVKGIRKFYYSLFLLFPVILLCLLVVPVFGVALLFFVKNEWMGEPGSVRYSDRHFRIELPYTGVLGSRPEHAHLVVKKGIIEYEGRVLDSIYDPGVMTYKIEQKSPSEIEIRTIPMKNGKYREEKMRVHLK